MPEPPRRGGLDRLSLIGRDGRCYEFVDPTLPGEVLDVRFNLDDVVLTRPATPLEVALRDQLRGAEGALREIVAADPVDLALDPNWPQRIAAEALQTLDPPSAGGPVDVR